MHLDVQYVAPTCLSWFTCLFFFFQNFVSKIWNLNFCHLTVCILSFWKHCHVWKDNLFVLGNCSYSILFRDMGIVSFSKVYIFLVIYYSPFSLLLYLKLFLLMREYISSLCFIIGYVCIWSAYGCYVCLYTFFACLENTCALSCWS